MQAGAADGLGSVPRGWMVFLGAPGAPDTPRRQTMISGAACWRVSGIHLFRAPCEGSLNSFRTFQLVSAPIMGQDVQGVQIRKLLQAARQSLVRLGVCLSAPSSGWGGGGGPASCRGVSAAGPAAGWGVKVGRIRAALQCSRHRRSRTQPAAAECNALCREMQRPRGRA